MTHQALASGSDAMVLGRWYVHDQLSSALSPTRVAAAELMTTELVSNAVRHSGFLGGDPIGLDVYVELDTVRISVVDAGPGLDPDRPILGQNVQGWGLTLIDRVSDRWGIHREHPHSVWFEIDR